MLPVRVIEVTFIENPSIQSAGESPIFTTSDVLAEEVVVDPVPEVLPLPPHAVSRDVSRRVRAAMAALVTNLYLEAFCMEGVRRRFIFLLLWP